MPRVFSSLPFSFHRRWRQWARQTRHRVYWDSWFPHVVVAVAVGLLGLANLLDGIMRGAPGFPALVHFKPMLPIGQVLKLRGLAGIPQAAAGAVILVMSLGLAFRSRFAWAVALLLSAATLALILHQSNLRWGTLTVFNALLLIVLLVFHRSFSRSSLAAGTLFSVVSVLLLLGYSVFGSYVLGQDFSPHINTLATALYFSVVTLSTVGYGDIVPKSDDARFFVISVIILGITVFATSISAIIVPLVNNRMQRLLAGEKKRMKQDHYIIIGDNALAHNTYRELKARHLPVAVIVSTKPENLWMQDGDWIVGDASDIEVLRQAGGERALAILALRADDSENAFIVMAAKELGGKARTVAAVKNSKNFPRVHRVGPDLIIAPDVLGGELLAMALSGEELNSDHILRKLFIPHDAQKAK
ncbi:MAG: voltage-gated potassium channel protein [Planctomycetes bacterium]|nr:voltage-gated potassium channel protein [Planctomycetota bacterium]